MNASTATVAKAGFDRGKKMRQKIPKVEAPSRRAASSSSFGIVIKNWRSRKIKKGQPNQAGIISGANELLQPIELKSTYWGISVTQLGSITVPSISRNKKFLPRARRRAKP